MKKKSLLTILIAILMTFSIVACSKGAKPNLGEYGYHGGYQYEAMTIDEGITLDGVLDEDIWADCTNTLTSTSTSVPYYNEYETDDSKKKFKWMDVHTYFGENGIYVAFEVYDNRVYYSGLRRQSRNTGVELYFADMGVSSFGHDSMSLRVSPTDGEPLIGFYRGTGAEYAEDKAPGQYFAGVTVNGTLNAQGPGGKEDDEGYVVELAISYNLFGKKIDAYQFTAAFVQVAAATGDLRYANSFIKGTGHLQPSTWKAVSNDGIIADKFAYVDRLVTWDEGIDMDGKLNEAFWIDAIENDKGKDWKEVGSGIGLNIYTHFTDLGLYIGLDSNDKYVYHNPDRAAKYNTGAEVFIVPKGQMSVTPDAKQMRFNVGGGGERWVGNNQSTAWQSGYFKAKAAGSIKGEGATMNTSSAEGWQGEIFVPWTELGVTENKDKSQIAIQTNLYHIQSDGYWENNSPLASAAGWKYISPNAAFNTQHNPQEEYFLFTKNGFKFNAVVAKDADLDVSNFTTGQDIVANNADLAEIIDAEKEYYYVDTIASVLDGGIAKVNDFISLKSPNTNGTLSIDGEELAYEIINGEYRLYFEKSEATLASLADPKVINYSNEIGDKATFKINYDANMAVNGRITAADTITESVFANMDTKVAMIKNSFSNGSVTNGFSVVTNEKGVYGVALLIDDGSSLQKNKAHFYVAYGEIDMDGVLKISADLATGEKAVSLYNGSWTFEHDYHDLVKVGVTNTLPEIGLGNDVSGYTVEFFFSWDVFYDEEEREFVKIQPTITFANEKGSTWETIGQYHKLRDDNMFDMKNYLRFDDAGFAPTEIYAQKEIVFIKDDTIADGGNYEQTVDFSYLGCGGLVNNAMADKTEVVSVSKADVTELNGGLIEDLEIDGLAAIATARYLEPNTKAINATAVTSYINFDYGAEDLAKDTLKNYLVENKEGVAFKEEEGSYEGDKYFEANMNTRSVKIDTKLGTDSFVVSMMVDGDKLRSYPTGTYSFILFGTGRVDAANNNNGDYEGFSVRIRGEGLQIRTDKGYASDIPFDMSKLDGWQRLTFNVDRSPTNITVTVFLGYELVATQKVDVINIDVENYGTLGIGGPGSYRDGEGVYPNVSVGIDDVIILKKTAIKTAQDVCNMLAFFDEYNGKYNFGIDLNKLDYSFNNFATADTVQGELQITNNLSGEVELGGAWAEAGYATLADDTVTYSLTKDKVKALAAGSSWYSVGGVKKYVSFNYTELGDLKLDLNNVSVWKEHKKGDNYEFTVNVSSSGIGVENGNNVEFKITDGTTTTDVTSEAKGNGDYLVKLPATVVEVLDEGEELNVVASIAGNQAIKSDNFTVNYNFIDNATVDKLVAGTMAYLNFDENIKDKANPGRKVEMAKGTATYEDGVDGKAIKLNPTTMRVALSDVELGTESFTMSFDIKTSAKCGDNNFELVSSLNTDTNTSGPYKDMDPRTFQVSHRGNNNRLRIAIGRNGDFPGGHEAAQNKLNLTGWQRYTIVLTRNIATLAGNTKALQAYDENGNYKKEWDVNAGGIKNSAHFEAPEMAKFELYVDGVLSDTKDIFYTKDQYIGVDDMLYLGGLYASRNYDFLMDNFVIYRGAMTAKEVRGMTSANSDYYELIGPRNGVSVADVQINYAQKDTLLSNGYALDVVVGEIVDATGATLVGAPAGVTLEATGASYKLLFASEAALNAFENTKTLTLKFATCDKPFDVTYTPLKTLYADETSYEVWNDDKASGNYVIKTGIYLDKAKSVALTGDMGVELTVSGIDGASVAYAGDTWNVTVPATAIEGQGVKTLAIAASGNTGVTPATFTLEYKVLDRATIDKLLANTETYLNFDDNIYDIVGSKATSMVGSAPTASYADGVDGKAIKLNPNKTALKISNYNLGTTSFTISFDVKIANGSYIANGDNYYELVASKAHDKISGGNTYDQHAQTFQFSYRGAQNRLRFQAGPNDGVPYMAGATANKNDNKVMKLETWQRITVVVERGLASGNSAKPEKVNYRLYIDGKDMSHTQDALSNNRNNQPFGLEDLYLGGDHGVENLDATKRDNDFFMDNFVIYRGVMTADEVRGMSSVNSSYYADLVEKRGVAVADVNFDFTEKEDVLASGYDLEVIDRGIANLTGATLESPVEGVELVETDGAYKLKFTSEAALNAFKTAQTLTLKFATCEKNFTVRYMPFDTLYVHVAEKLYDFEKSADNKVIRDIRVTADEEGVLGVSDVEFDGDIDVLYDLGDGNYVVKIPFNTAAYEVSHEEISEPTTFSFTVQDNATIVKDTDAPNTYDGYTTKGGTQGGKYFDLGSNAFDTDSFSVSFVIKGLNNRSSSWGNGETALITTSQPDAKQGFTLYYMANKVRFRCGNGTLDPATAADITWDVSDYDDWTHILVTFDRSEKLKVTYTVYIDGERLGAATYTIPSDTENNKDDPDFDTDWTKGRFVIGGSNALYSTADSAHFGGGHTINYGIAGVVATKGIIDVEAATQYVKYNVQPAIDDYEA